MVFLKLNTFGVICLYIFLTAFCAYFLVTETDVKIVVDKITSAMDSGIHENNKKRETVTWQTTHQIRSVIQQTGMNVHGDLIQHCNSKQKSDILALKQSSIDMGLLCYELAARRRDKLDKNMIQIFFSFLLFEKSMSFLSS